MVLELAYQGATLHDLDDLPRIDVIAAGFFSDVLPFPGLLGLVDWRLSGALSQLVRRGFLTGNLGEVFCFAGANKLSSDKVLVVGHGPAEAFDDRALSDVVGVLVRSVDGLGAGSTLIELPGRATNRVTLDRALSLFREATASITHPIAWRLFDQEPIPETKEGRSR